jgi:LPS export ABC transporter protein LptC
MKFLKFLIVLELLSESCSLTYEKDQLPQPDQVPQMAFETLHQTGVKDGRILYTMESDRADVYQTKKQMLLKNFQFQEYDPQGALASRGEAASATIDTATNDARIEGGLKARSIEQGVTLEVGGQSGGLTWSNDDRILKTDPKTAVQLSKDDGSKIEAYGLLLDLGSNTMELEEGVRGTWTPETKKDEKKTVSPSVPPRPSAR